MRITPEQFDTIYKVFVFLILCFFAFAGLQILMMKARWRDEEERRKQRKPKTPGGTGDYQPVTKRAAATAATFGTSGVGASDMAPAADFTIGNSSSDTGGSFDTSGSDSGGGDSGGGDFSGGGGDSGGGGSSGGWS